MRETVKFILIGLVVMFFYWVWTAVTPFLFNGLADDEALIVGTGLFLSFEMAVLTGVILSRIRRP